MIIVAGHIRVSVESRSAFLEGSAEAVRMAREEPDCIDFSVSADCVDEERVNVSECWQNRSALMSFRGEGPTDEHSAQIISAEANEFEVQAFGGIPGD